MSLLERANLHQEQDLTEEEVIQRAVHAQRLLDDSVLQDAFDYAEAEYYKLWLESSEEMSQTECRSAILALDDIQRWLRSMVAAGEVAEHNLRQRQ